MKIKQIDIENYRSIKKIQLDMLDFSVLIGANNSGKSNILRALLFFFQSSEKILPEDVFSFFETEQFCLSVTIKFVDLSDQEKTTFKKYLLHDDSIIIRRGSNISVEGNKTPKCSPPIYNGWIEEPDIWFLKESAYERLSSKEKRENEVSANLELSPLLELGGRFTKELLTQFQEEYISKNKSKITFTGKFEETPLLGRQNVASGILPDFIFIPAIRDLSDETKINSKTLLGKLLLNVIDVMITNDEEFQKIISEVENSINKLNNKDSEKSPLVSLERELSDELATWDVSTSININPPNVAKLFELGTSLNIDDGVMTGAESKGNGLQRAVIFGLLKVIANHDRNSNGEQKSRAGSESQIYAIEEAELYLHPHKQREFYKNLKTISSNKNSQVILTTHSSHFVHMDDYKSLTLIRKYEKEHGTEKYQCCIDIFDQSTEEKQQYKLVHYINPDNGELFFARKVILVEGESEKVVFPYLSDRLGKNKPDVTIIDCGSKFNLPLYIKLLNHFEIQYIVVFDQDPMSPPYANLEKEKSDRRTFEYNNEIIREINHKLGTYHMMEPDFEGFFNISKTQGTKLGKGLAAIKHFQSIDDNDISKDMLNLLDDLYK